MKTLEDLRRIAKAATPGPWVYRQVEYEGVIQEKGDSTGWLKDYPQAYVCKVGGWGYSVKYKNGDFIATFNPELVLAMIDEIEARRKYNDNKSRLFAQYPEADYEVDESYEDLQLHLAIDKARARLDALLKESL